MVPASTSVQQFAQTVGSGNLPTPLDQARANCAARLDKQPVGPYPGGHRPDAKGQDARGNERVMADIAAATPASIEEQLRRAMDVLHQRIGLVGIEIGWDVTGPGGRWWDNPRESWTIAASVQGAYASRLPSGGRVLSYGPDLGALVDDFVRRWRAAVAEHDRMVAANVTDAGKIRGESYRDDGDATKGTLPLVHIGPEPIPGVVNGGGQ